MAELTTDLIKVGISTWEKAQNGEIISSTKLNPENH